MQVDTNVSESDVAACAMGSPPPSPSMPTRPALPRQVAQVRNAPITVQNVVTYDVVIAVDNPGLELKPGMTANVSITAAKRDPGPSASRSVRSASVQTEAEPGLRTRGRRRAPSTSRAGRRAPSRRGGSRHPRQSARGGAESDLHEGDPIVVGLGREGTDAAATPRLKGSTG